MHTEHGSHRDTAIEALAAREYERAGDAYARAGWRVLADPRDGVSPFAADDKGWVGGGLQYLVTSALAYRVAGRETRATRRAVAGVAVARDLENGLDQPAQHACLAEFVADCRVAGGLDDAGAAYEEAAAAYLDAAATTEQPQALATSPLFEAAAAPIRQVARGPADGEIAVDWDDLHGDDPAQPGRFLAARPAYKRQRFPGLVGRMVEDRYLAVPRGTTEYDNDRYRCPECGSSDVNWAGGGVYCLRCSTPMAEQ